MSTLSLDDVLSLNTELAALADAGIPMNLYAGDSQAALGSTLERINSSLSLRSNLGQPLADATTENEELPPVYRSALEAGLRSNRLSATLDGVSRQVIAEAELRSTIGRALIPPLIVLTLGYFGFIFVCLYYAPTIEGMYEQVDQPFSRPVNFLVAMHTWLPCWATLLPLLVIGAVVSWLRGWGNLERLIPGARRYTAAVRNANFANQLAALIENDVPLVESVPLAAAVTGDAGLIAASTALSDSYDQRERLPADSEVLSSLPPLLRWALTGDLGEQSLPEILRFAVQTYRHKAQRRAAVWRFVLPTMIGALLGGVIVLAYALSVFGPFVRLLEDLAY